MELEVIEDAYGELKRVLKLSTVRASPSTSFYLSLSLSLYLPPYSFFVGQTGLMHCICCSLNSILQLRKNTQNQPGGGSAHL